jgi:hypothetical protein
VGGGGVGLGEVVFAHGSLEGAVATEAALDSLSDVHELADTNQFLAWEAESE